MDFSFITGSWNRLIYGWDLNQIRTTLLVVPDFSHWSIDYINPKLDEDKFARQLEDKGVHAIIYKGTDSTHGKMFTDVTAKFWWGIGEKFGLARGCYHWLQPGVDPTLAFHYHNNFIKDYPTELPYIMDFEEKKITSASDYLWRASVWLSLAKEQLGDDLPVVYSAKWYIDGYIKPGIVKNDWEKKIGWLRNYPLWVAFYSRYFPTSFYPWTNFIGWQYTDAADFPYYKDDDNYWGDAWGIPSKGLDLSLFRTEWLSKYTNGITIPPGEEEMPHVWTDKAKLLYAAGNQRLTDAQLYNYDGVIAKIGTEFTGNVQVAFNAKRPIILFAENKIFRSHIDAGINEEKWAKADQEILIRDPEFGLDRYFFSNGVKRKIHGVMLDCSATVTDDTKDPLTAQWLVRRATYMIEMIKARYNVPVYLYMNLDPVTVFTGEDREAVNLLIIKYGVSTVSRALELEDGFPASNQKPKLPYDDTSKMKWYFWLYDFTDGWKFLYNGNATVLYEELNFTADSTIPDPDPDPDPNPDPELPDLTELKADVKFIKDLLLKHFKE